MKLIRSFLAAVLTAVLLVSASSAEEIRISGRVNAVRLADKALEENYGITLLLQEYFVRTAEEKDDGSFLVSYEGVTDYAYVLGRYDVAVRDGQVTAVSWSRDGEDTSGGFEAEAWGKEQIMEMLRLNQEAGTTEPFEARISEINDEHGFGYIPENLSDEEWEEEQARAEQEREEARIRSSLSIGEMTEIARRAVALLYGLAPEEEQALESAVLEEEELPMWYEMYEGEPCYRVCLALGDPEGGDILPNGLVYTEKEGNYWVFVNGLTGMVEDVYYSAGIGGNG